MKNIILTLFAFAIVFSCKAQNNLKQKKINNMFETFDFEKWEEDHAEYKGKGKHPDNYYLKDGSEIMISEPELYITPKNPVFYVIYKEFYENNFIKRKGKYFGLTSNILSIGIWYEFDDKGNLTREINEDTKFGKFGYNEVLEFLDSKGEINLSTGENRENLEILNYYYSEKSDKKLWKIWIKKGNPYPVAPLSEDKGERIGQDGKIYYLDGNTGQQIQKKDLILYKDIIPNFEEDYPNLK